MNSQSSGRNGGRRPRGGSSRRRSGGGEFRPRNQGASARPPAPKTLWQKIAAFFGGGDAPTTANRGPEPERTASRESSREPRARETSERERPSRKPESVEVTTPRLYVGNLSFDATESDLFELFNGVGQVQNAEVVTYKHNQRSKGFAFVQMLTVEEAQRAVAELHDKDFLGRKLLVSGAKSSEQHSAS